VSPAVVPLLALLALPGAALAQPDLELTKSGPTSAVAGTAITYTFTIVNQGASTAANVELDDVLPAGLTLIGDSLDSCGVTATAANHQQTVNCALPNIPAGGTLVVRMNVKVEHDFLVDRGTGATNTATVTTTGEANPADNTDAAPSLLVSAAADLAVYTFAPANPVPAGEIFTYSIYVDNLGPSSAEQIIIGDNLAASSNVSIQSCALSVSQSGGSITQFTCTTGQVIGSQFLINIGQMATNFVDPRGAPCDWNPSADPGEEEFCNQSFGHVSAGRVRISFRLLALQDLTIQAFTTVASDTPDPDTSNNVALDTVDFTAVADLEVRAVAGATVSAGQTASWTITAINHGPSAAQNALLLDRLPAGLVDGSVAITGNVVSDVLGTPDVEAPVSCTLGTPGDPDDPALCDLGGLPEGWGAILTVSGRVHPNFVAVHDGLAPPIGLTNDVAITSDTLDAVFATSEPDDCTPSIGPCPPAPDQPNFASATVPIGDSANRSLQVFAVGPVVAGQPFHYEFQIGNLGPSEARDLTLRAFLPAEITFLSAVVDLEGGVGFDPLPCHVTIGSNVLFCPLGDLTITGPVPVFVFVDVVVDPDVADGATLSLSADVNLSDTPDPVPANNAVNLNVVVNNLAPDYFTQEFGAGSVDLEGWQLELTPTASPDGYAACVTGVTPPFMTDGTNSTSDGIILPLDDDDFAEVVLADGKKIKLYGVKYDRVYVGSNGYITLLTGDPAPSGDAATHFDLRRVSGFFADLDPSAGGKVRWVQLDHLLEVCWEAVPGYEDADTSTFCIELHFDGRIQWRLAALDALPGVVGISNGGGLPDPFFASDFAPPGSDYPLCPGIFSDDFETSGTARWD
jgi:uncharacterized repeat protein (TIGR01451 family)